MSKPLLIGGGLTLAALAVTPYFVGNGVETEFNQTLEKVNAHPLYSAKVVSYNKGWFSSHADVEVAMNLEAMMEAQGKTVDDDMALENYSVNLTYKVYHGPVYFGDGMGVALAKYKLEAPAIMMRDHLNWDETKPLYRNEGTLGLLGGLNYEDEIASFTFTDKKNEGTLSFTGYKGKAETKGDILHYQGLGENFTVESDKLDMTLSNMMVSLDWDGDFAASLNGELFDSTGTFKVGEILLSGGEFGDDTVKLSNLAVDAVTEIDEQSNQANVEMLYSLGKFVAGEFEGSDFTLGVALNHLDMDFVKAYQTFSNETMLLPQDEIDSKMEALFEAHLLPLLSASPEINITKLTGTIPEGSFDGHLNTKLVNVSQLPDVFINPGFWLKHTLADAKLSADEGVVELAATSYMKSQLKNSPQSAEMTDEQVEEMAKQQIPMVLGMITAQGFVKQDAGKYVTEIELKEGKAQVNGTEIPLPVGD